MCLLSSLKCSPPYFNEFHRAFIIFSSPQLFLFVLDFERKEKRENFSSRRSLSQQWHREIFIFQMNFLTKCFLFIYSSRMSANNESFVWVPRTETFNLKQESSQFATNFKDTYNMICNLHRALLSPFMPQTFLEEGENKQLQRKGIKGLNLCYKSP